MAETQEYNNRHDYSCTQSKRIETYNNAKNGHRSYMTNKGSYARVPLRGMPNPKGQIYER